MFLPTDAQFTYVAALINSKQVDSLHKYQGRQVFFKQFQNVSQIPNPKWLLLCFQAELCSSNQDAAQCRMPLGHHTGLAGVSS